MQSLESYMKWVRFYRDELDMYIAPVQFPIIGANGLVDPLLHGKEKYYKVTPVGYKGRWHGKDDYLRDVTDEEAEEWHKAGYGLAVISKGWSDRYKKYQRIFDIDSFGKITKEEFWKKYADVLAGNFVTESHKGYHVFVFSDTEITLTKYTIETPQGDTIRGEVRWGPKSGHTVEPPSLSVDDSKWVVRGQYTAVNFALSCGELPEGWAVTNWSETKGLQEEKTAGENVDVMRSILEGKTKRGQGQGVYNINLRHIGTIIERIKHKDDIDEVSKALEKSLAYNKKHELGYPENAVKDTFFSILKKETAKNKMNKVEVDMETIRKAGGSIVQDTSDGAVYIQIDGKHNYLLRSAKARRWIIEVTEPKDTAQVNNLIMRLDAAIERQVRLRYRVARNVDGALCYDIGDEEGTIVTVKANEWDCGVSPDIRLFKSGSGQKKQVLPIREGKIEDIFDFINVCEELRPLFLCLLVYYFVPDVQYPILSFFGAKGSGKSTAAGFLREIIDPNEAPFDSINPKKIEDAWVALSSGHLSIVDNLSYVSQEISDLLCLFSTGGAYRKRALYTDGDTHLNRGLKPIVLTSVTQEIRREDLLSRTILIEVSPITEKKPPSALQKEFQMKLPGILGAIFDVLGALRLENSEKTKGLTRMSDFHLYARAISTLLGYEDKIDALLQNNFNLQEEEAINNNDTGEAVMSYMANKSVYEGTPSDWVRVLSETNPSFKKKQPNWFGRDMRRLAETFRISGIKVTFLHTNEKNKKRLIRAENIDGPDDTVPPDDFDNF